MTDGVRPETSAFIRPHYPAAADPDRPDFYRTVLDLVISFSKTNGLRYWRRRRRRRGRLLSATPGWLLLMIHLVFAAFFPDACWLLLSVQTSEAAQRTRHGDASKQRELNEFNKITWVHKDRITHLYSLSATQDIFANYEHVQNNVLGREKIFFWLKMLSFGHVRPKPSPPTRRTCKLNVTRRRYLSSSPLQLHFEKN